MYFLRSAYCQFKCPSTNIDLDHSVFMDSSLYFYVDLCLRLLLWFITSSFIVKHLRFLSVKGAVQVHFTYCANLQFQFSV